MSTSPEELAPHPDRIVLALHVASTLYLMVTIWVIQLVVYPSFGNADRARARERIAAHGRRIRWIVGPAMVVELVTGLWLCAGPWFPFRDLATLGLLLIAFIWGSTLLVHGPAFFRLPDGDDVGHRRLVNLNWFRTAAWTARGILVLLLLLLAQGPEPVG
ncbi:MAG: hypothetical protein ABIP29_10185 [Candidatus Eisenbacteria bacterium]